MKKTNILICLVFLSGCSFFQHEESTITQPKLLQQSPLPTINQSIYKDKFEFDCNLLINEKGEVETAKLLNGSGDVIWDSLATLSLLTWKFSPAILNGNPTKVMVRRKFIVVYEQPKELALAEIQFDNRALADSAYKALLNGADFTGLVMKYSISSSRDKYGYLGKVNVKLYSKGISEILSKLADEEFTKPLKYGENYIIFKRLKLSN
jgi:parvulin-like peptidyl-prolyl isomerase